MSFRIELSPDALAHLESMRKYDQRTVVEQIERNLRHRPLAPTRHRKPMRSSIVATWELRAGKFRVYYDVDDVNRTVWVRAVGIKIHNRVSIGGTEVELP